MTNHSPCRFSLFFFNTHSHQLTTGRRQRSSQARHKPGRTTEAQSDHVGVAGGSEVSLCLTVTDTECFRTGDGSKQIRAKQTLVSTDQLNSLVGLQVAPVLLGPVGPLASPERNHVNKKLRMATACDREVCPPASCAA